MYAASGTYNGQPQGQHFHGASAFHVECFLKGPEVVAQNRERTRLIMPPQINGLYHGEYFEEGLILACPHAGTG